jgi:hypothetical protein
MRNQETSSMHRLPSLLLLVASVGLASTQDFPVTATWSAAAQPEDSSTVSGALTIQQHLGYRMDASFTITAAPGTIYQWRVFRGTCADTIAAANSSSASGILLFATAESYPDIAVGTAGTGTAAPAIAGALDSLTAYSVRIRPAQKSTTWDGTKPISCGDLQRSPTG